MGQRRRNRNKKQIKIKQTKTHRVSRNIFYSEMLWILFRYLVFCPAQHLWLLRIHTQCASKLFIMLVSLIFIQINFWAINKWIFENAKTKKSIIRRWVGRKYAKLFSDYFKSKFGHWRSFFRKQKLPLGFGGIFKAEVEMINHFSVSIDKCELYILCTAANPGAMTRLMQCKCEKRKKLIHLCMREKIDINIDTLGAIQTMKADC